MTEWKKTSNNAEYYELTMYDVCASYSIYFPQVINFRCPADYILIPFPNDISFSEPVYNAPFHNQTYTVTLSGEPTTFRKQTEDYLNAIGVLN